MQKGSRIISVIEGMVVCSCLWPISPTPPLHNVGYVFLAALIHFSKLLRLLQQAFLSSLLTKGLGCCSVSCNLMPLYELKCFYLGVT